MVKGTAIYEAHACRRRLYAAAFFAALVFCLSVYCLSPMCREALSEENDNARFAFQVNAVLENKSSANLRESPSLNAPIVGVMTRADTLRVVGIVGDFYEVYLNDTHCYVYATTVALRAERIVLDAPTRHAVKADIALEKYALSRNEKLCMSGTVSSDTPICSVSAYIYDAYALSVEAFHVFRLPEPSYELDLSCLNTFLSDKRLSSGEKRMYLVVNDGVSEEIAAEQVFYVLGAAKEPAHMTNLCNLSSKALYSLSLTSVWKPEWSGACVTIELPNEPAAALLTLSWQLPPQSYTVTMCDSEGETISERTIQSGFYLEAINLDSDDIKKIRIQTSDFRAILSTVRVYEKGKISDAVQQWQPIPEKLDIMVVSAHQDDEFLFFGGTIPQAAAREKAIGMVYMAYCGRYRYVEALDALWTAGLKTHPVFLNLNDLKAETLERAEMLWAAKKPLNELVALIRRYRPNVIVTHDLNGEYGHNQHIYTAILLEQAVEKAADAAFDPESAEIYGTWSTPKLYSHLGDINPITVDWNQPVGEEKGITPSVLAEVAYDKYQSQQMYFSMSEHGVLYDNRRFGLVHSTVGEDIERNDFFENIEEENTMKKTYTVKRMPENTEPICFSGDLDANNLPDAYATLNEADIADYPWLSLFPDRFETHFRMGYNSENLFVLMYAKEAPVQSKETNFGGCQYLDSCMEFFFKPFPERDDRYLNIEINPHGVPHVGLGESRHNRNVYKTAIPGMTINSVIGDNGIWAICYNIPASFIRELYGDFPKSGDTMSGNFYKCSEDIHPHFGTWSPVDAPKPDFHRPEFFTDVVLE